MYFPAQLNLFSSWSEAAAAKKCPHKGDRLNHSVHPPSSKFWQLFINQFVWEISLIFIALLPPFYMGFWFYISTIFTAPCFSLAYIGLISEVKFLETYWQFFNVSYRYFGQILVKKWHFWHPPAPKKKKKKVQFRATGEKMWISHTSPKVSILRRYIVYIIHPEVF